MSGKGSKPRPYSVSQDAFSDRFDAIFGKKQMGSGVTGSASVSTTEGSRSSLDSPATPVFVNADTLE
jgi:hypothetical protein